MFKIKLKDEKSIAPTKAYNGDAGFDVYYCDDHRIALYSGGKVKIPLGFSIELPKGWVAMIQEKSGMAAAHGIITIGNIIDSTYRGECHAILSNIAYNIYSIQPKQKVAQMLILPCYTGKDYEIVDQLTPSDRGEGGFGSTGL